MKLIRNPVLSFFAALVVLTQFGSDSFSQDVHRSETEVSDQFVKFNEAHQQEKVYLHFDKPFYLPGETIWYKAYLADASLLTPSLLSRIIYVELLDHTGEMIDRQILKAGEGFANGEFQLSPSLQHGKYYIRAYTQWMRNFDQDYFFLKEIWVYDPQIAYNLAGADSARTVTDLIFFPEGGNLVAGVTSKVAFKAVNSSGEGIYVKGEITDQDGHMIIPFESFHLGMGAFLLKPEKDKTYFANLSTGGDASYPFKIPEALEEGLVLSVDNSSGEFILVNISANETYLKENSASIFILVQAAGKIYHASKGDLSQGSSYDMAIPKKNLPSGIVQITLFNGEGNPECERLVFVNHHDALLVSIETNKKSYYPREEVLLKLLVRDCNGNPVEGNFSMAVTDASQVIQPEKYNDNILTYLLLGSELKGNIEQPAFYFTKENPGSETALDYLMLTQGWRRFLWKEILSETWPALHYNMEKEVIHVKGQVVDPSDHSPLSLTMLSVLMLKDGKSFSRYTNQDGFFDFNIPATSGKESLFFDAKDTQGQHLRVKIIVENNIPEPHFTASEEFSLVSPEISYCLKKRKEQAQIESSFSYAAERNASPGSDSGFKNAGTYTNRFVVAADYSIGLEDFNPFSTMTEVFREVVPYVSVVYKRGENKLRVYSSELMKQFEQPPLFLVDGLPTFNKPFVLNLDPEEVETIEVINSIGKIRPFGFLGLNGVVAIHTKHGTTTLDDIAEHAIIEIQGCYDSREFYAPRYDHSLQTDKSKPDLRSLIYWNPMVATDSNGEVILSFYNTDNITKFEIRTEGISIDGTPGVAEQVYHTIPRKYLP
jgi:hypothetical protein